MTTKIEKRIPLPKGRGENNEYPLGKMIIGDSFYTEKNIDSARARAYQYAFRNDVKFTARKEGLGIRIWRTK